MINHALSSVVKSAGKVLAAIRMDCARGDLPVIAEFYPDFRVANRFAAQVSNHMHGLGSYPHAFHTSAGAMSGGMTAR